MVSKLETRVPNEPPVPIELSIVSNLVSTDCDKVEMDEDTKSTSANCFSLPNLPAFQ